MELSSRCHLHVASVAVGHAVSTVGPSLSLSLATSGHPQTPDETGARIRRGATLSTPGPQRTLRGSVRALAAQLAPGQVQRAIGYFQLALEIAREIGNRIGEGAELGNLGNTYIDLRQMERAIKYHQPGLKIAREIGDRRGEAYHSWNLGLVYEESDPAKAVELMLVCVEYEREISHPDAPSDAERVEQIRRRAPRT